MSRVTIKLNREEDGEGRLAIFSRMPQRGLDQGSVYENGDALETVWDGYVPTRGETRDTLNDAYAKFNRGSPTFIGDDEYPQRSLSVGDVVEVDGEAFAVASFGFEKLSARPLTTKVG